MEREEYEYSSKAESEENEKKLSLEEIHTRYHISEEDKGLESGSHDSRIKRGFQEDCTNCIRSLPRSRYTPTSSDDDEEEEVEVNHEWEQYYEDMDIYEELGYVPDEAEDVESNEARTLSASTVEREEYEMATTKEKEVPQNNVKQEQVVDAPDAAEASAFQTSSVCNSLKERDTTENSSKAEGEEIEKKLSLEEIHNRYHISEEDKAMESGSNDSRIKRGFQDDCAHCIRSLPRSRYTPTSSDDDEEEEVEVNYEWEQYYEDMDIYEELGYVPDEAEYIESIEARSPSASTVEREEYEMATTQENPQNNVRSEQAVDAPDAAETSEVPTASDCNTLEERDIAETSSKAEGTEIENKMSLEEIHNRYHISEEGKGMESSSNDSDIKRGFQEECTYCLRSLPRSRYTPTSSDDDEEEEVNYHWEHYYADVDLYEEIGYVPDEAEDVESNYTIDLTLSRTSLDELNFKPSTSKDN